MKTEHSTLSITLFAALGWHIYLRKEGAAWLQDICKDVPALNGGQVEHIVSNGCTRSLSLENC